MTSTAEMTVSILPDNSLIKPFLLANKAEVKRMCITEYDEERTFAEQKEEGIAEGKELGIAEGKVNTLIELVNDGILTLSDAAKRAGMTDEEFKARMTAKD